MSQADNTASNATKPIPSIHSQVEDLDTITMLAQSRVQDLANADEPVKPLRICITGYRSAPFGGGQGIYIKYLSKALVEAGHQVDVISGQPYPQLDSRVRLIKMPSLDLFNHGLLSLRPKHLRSLTNIIEWTSKLTGGFAEPYCFSRRLAKYLQQHGDRYDIVHDNQCLGWDMLKLQERGTKLITTIHHPITSDLDIALNASNKWWERILIRRWHAFLGMQKRVAAQLNHVVTVSQKSKTDIATAFNIAEDSIRLVYNGIDTAEFRPLTDRVKKRWQIMATASADQPLKGLRFLLLALASLRQSYPEIELLLVGKPKPGGDTEKLIAKLGIGDRIRFVHGISTEELVQHYAESSIAVVPSVYEGFGLPAGEAMACGVPVVSTNGGALPEVVGDAGIVVPVKDELALAKGIEKLLLDDDLRESLGRQGRQRIEQQFSWRLAASEFTALYATIIDGDTLAGSDSNCPVVEGDESVVDIASGVANANG